MAATASAIQIAANRANAQLSTGPTSAEGKRASSVNHRTHGLTSQQAFLPGEDSVEYQLHHENYLSHYQPATPLVRAAVLELADLQWRLRRVSAFESQILDAEVHNLSTNPELKTLTDQLQNQTQILAIAFGRLVQSRVLPNLYNLEARLSRRAEKLQYRLDNTPRLAPSAVPAETREEFDLDELFQKAKESQIEAIVHPAPVRQRPVCVTPTPGRNEFCPCKSGLKYKRCCANKPRGAAA